MELQNTAAENTFSKVAGYKLTEKSGNLLCTNKKWTEKDLMEAVFFTVASNNLKYLGITLTKKVKDWVDKNLKTLKKVKKISEDRCPLLTYVSGS